MFSAKSIQVGFECFVGQLASIILSLGKYTLFCKISFYFRITRSDMNCQRVKYILRGLSDSQNLETLDFSHCKIGDEGASSIGKFITKRENLRTLVLADNVFGK